MICSIRSRHSAIAGDLSGGQLIVDIHGLGLEFLGIVAEGTVGENLFGRAGRVNLTAEAAVYPVLQAKADEGDVIGNDARQDQVRVFLEAVRGLGDAVAVRMLRRALPDADVHLPSVAEEDVHILG